MLVEKDLEIQRLHKPAGDKTHEDKMDDHQSVMPKMMEQLRGMQQSQNEMKWNFEDSLFWTVSMGLYASFDPLALTRFPQANYAYQVP